MYIYGMWPWKVLKCPSFWAEVAVKAWRGLATLRVRVPSGFTILLEFNYGVLYSMINA
jgi:hypothetical protein